jgi:hypothetical protein
MSKTKKAAEPEARELASQVLASQGRAVGMLAGMTDAEIAGLAQLHGTDDLAAKFAEWLVTFYEHRKAVVDAE